MSSIRLPYADTFQSAPRVEGDTLGELLLRAAREFQSAPSRGGRSPRGVDHGSGLRVSIRALAWRAIPVTVTLPVLALVFQSAPSRGGRSENGACTTGASTRFNPRPSRGGR